MSRRQHEKQLAKARAQRRADSLRRRQQRTRVTVIVVVVLFVAAVIGVGLFLGRDEPSPEIEDVEAPGEQEPTAAPDVDACPPADDAPEVDSEIYDEAPTAEVAEGATATLATTCGDITIDLDVEGAPATVATLAALLEDGYYDGIPFHRVINGFVIQAGDPAGTGCGQEDCAQGFDPDAPTFPGFGLTDEESTAATFQTGPNGGIAYPRGTVAMARTSQPNSTGSQFFIVQGDPIELPDDSYIVVGTVTDGMDVVDQIAEQPTGENDRPVDEIRIVSFVLEGA